MTTALAFTVALGRATATEAPTDGIAQLRYAAPSQDALIRRALRALGEKDARTLRLLRVTESEYRNIILPSTVPPGSPPRHYRDDVSDFFWRLLDTKSAMYEQYLLNTVGGRGLSRVKDRQYAKGKTQYAGYTAYKQVRLVVEDGSGQQEEMATGSIVEIGGRFKFMSFIRD